MRPGTTSLKGQELALPYWTQAGTNGFLVRLFCGGRSLSSLIAQGLILMSAWCDFAFVEAWRAVDIL